MFQTIVNPNLNRNSQQAYDIERFREFSSDYLAFNSERRLVMDARYSLVPNEISPLWGIIIDPIKGISNHVEWWENRTPSAQQRLKFLSLIFGEECHIL